MSTSYISPYSGSGGHDIDIDLGKNQTRAQITKTFILSGSGSRAGSNKLIVTQDYAPLMNEYDVSGGNTVTVSDDVSTPVSFEGHANGKKMKYMAPSEANVSSLISFAGFSCKETSGSVSGQAITASFGDVENFEGGLSEYDYFINVIIPSGTTSGRYGVVLVTADSTSGPTESVTYYVDVAEHQTVPIEIHAVYKSYDQIVETLDTDLTWQEGSGTVNSEDAEVETQQGSSDYAYDTYCIAQTEVNTTTLKLKVAADLTTTSTRILQSTAMVYASSSEETLPGYITNGTFKTGGITLSSINVASAISGATEYTVNMSSVRTSLGLSAGDPFNIYILFDTTTPPTPVGPEILTEQAQYEVQRNQTPVVAKGKIGYDLTVRNWSMQRSYKATVSLVCSGDPVDCGIEWVDSNTEGTLYDNTSSPTTIAADSAFSVTAEIANGRGILITDILSVSGETYSAAETMEYVLDLMENQMMWFEIDLWYNSGSGDVHYAGHPVQIYYSSNNFVPIPTD